MINNSEAHNSNILNVHEKWISFSSDTLLLAKKILGFTEANCKGKTDKVQIEEYKQSINSFESFLTMSRDDLQSLKMKNVWLDDPELTK